MKTDTSKKIVQFIQLHKQVSAHELIEYLSISPQAVFKQLKRLIEKNEIEKIGSPPKVYYFLPEKKGLKTEVVFENSIRNIINENFLFITPLGEVKSGIEGFFYWCNSRKQEPLKTASEYVKTLEKYEAFKKNDLIDGLDKAKKTFSEVYLKHLFYLDFYSIERFGKTKLGQLLLYAKQSQNMSFIKDLIKTIKPRVEKMIDKYSIDAVCFVPPTVKREVQFMNVLKNGLGLKTPILSVTKVKTQIPIPQKTLSKLEDRIENAKRTIIVDDKNAYKNVLIIDDAVGSGATINETAHQLKEKRIAKNVIGLAITGSFKGFEVISEV